MGTRRQARIIAMQALFGWEMNKVPIDDLLDFCWLENHSKEEVGENNLYFARILVSGTVENVQTIDRQIQKHLDNWDFYRLGRVDLAILRMSVFSLLFQNDIPESVTIDEAVDIAKEFGTDKSYKFINGVLDGIRKNQGIENQGEK